MQCVCGQDRQCLPQTTEPLEEDLQPVDTFQYSATLPASTGENKYTENMTPGYTGKGTSAYFLCCWSWSLFMTWQWHPSVLWRCWLGDKNGIWLVKAPQNFTEVYFRDRPNHNTVRYQILAIDATLISANCPTRWCPTSRITQQAPNGRVYIACVLCKPSKNTSVNTNYQCAQPVTAAWDAYCDSSRKCQLEVVE